MSIENNSGYPTSKDFIEDNCDKRIKEFLEASAQGDGTVIFEPGAPGYEASAAIPVLPDEREQFMDEAEQAREAEYRARTPWGYGGEGYYDLPGDLEA